MIMKNSTLQTLKLKSKIKSICKKYLTSINVLKG